MEDCIFCKIINQEIPSKKVYEDDFVYAFMDVNPQAPTHFLVVPKEHISMLTEINDKNAAVIAKVYEAIAKIVKDFNINDGFRVVSNCGESAGQTVFHIHFHVLSGRDMTWPPG